MASADDIAEDDDDYIIINEDIFEESFTQMENVYNSY